MNPTLTFQFSSPALSSEKLLDRMVTEGIEKLTRGEISHVDYVTPQGTLIGAHLNGGVQERAADYEKFGLRIRVTVPVTAEQAAAALAYARSKIGTSYDAEDILGIAIGDSRLHDAHDLICSCLAANILDNEIYRIYRVAKVHWQVSPEELRFALTMLPGAVEERIEG
jgi:hypothetical protein